MIPASFMSGSAEELALIKNIAWGMIATAPVVFGLLFSGITAAYGRYSSASWGPLVNAKVAWVVQECPVVVWVVVSLFTQNPAVFNHTANKVLLMMIGAHYVNRTLIFPLRTRGGKPTPFIPFIMAFFFCVVNGYIQTRWITYFHAYPDSWTSDPRFLIGVALFVFGMAVNMHSDHVLINLRKPGETGYKIPRGGMFEYISGANFFGEILEWTGFAIAGWFLTGAAFAIFTFSNIGVRAIHHHQWYLKTFKDYPRERKALVPFVY